MVKWLYPIREAGNPVLESPMPSIGDDDDEGGKDDNGGGE
jgi:hypothetical protein